MWNFKHSVHPLVSIDFLIRCKLWPIFFLFKSIIHHKSWLEDICMLNSGLVVLKICALYLENILIKPMAFMNMKQVINAVCLFKRFLIDDNILNWNRLKVSLKYFKSFNA